MSPMNSPVDEVKTVTGADVISPQSSDLCLSCGLCCDGSIFGRARLRPEEYEVAGSEGLERIDQDGESFFRLGCPCLDKTACQIYGKRPETCRTFRCALLRRLDSGEIELAAAEAITAEARRLADRADSLNDRVESRSQARERWHRGLRALTGRDAGGSEDRAEPRWLIAMTALNRFLDQHFRHAFQRQISDDDGGPRPQAEERR